MTKPKSKKASKAQKLSPEEQEARLLRRMMAMEDAAEDILAFARYINPDPEDFDDVQRTTWQTAAHHQAIADRLHRIEAGDLRRLLISLQPRAGKTTLSVHLLVPWYLGRHPERSVIVATASDSLAEDHGRKVREIMLSPAYRQVFPHVDINGQIANVSKIFTPQGGAAFFVGRDGLINGRGGDLIIADDLLKSDAEAASATIRNKVWGWWNSVLMPRAMTERAAVILCMTRWHEDDPPGRLIDPANDHYVESEAARWDKLCIPALAEPGDPLGREPGEPLWPERFSRAELESIRAKAPRTFEALYQGRPTPTDGTLINEGWLRHYEQKELPKNLTMFIGTDLAVSGEANRRRDSTVLIPAGVDEDGTVFIMGDVVWEQLQSDKIADRLVEMIKAHNPRFVVMEKGAITKAIMPFVQNRMVEEGAHAPILTYAPTTDKLARFQSMLARIARGQVRFPTTSPWWGKAKAELMSFPNASHDDFVDALSSIAIAIDRVTRVRGPAPGETKPVGPAWGTMAWLKQQTRRRELQEAARRRR